MAGLGRRRHTGRPTTPTRPGMAQRIDDLEAITKVIQLYIDGSAGDVAKLKQAFHAEARMYGHIGEVQHAIPISGFIDMVANAKGSMAGARYRAKIVSVDVVGDAGMAVLAEEDYLGCDFVDYFSMARIDGQWKIVNKTYAHTGGKLPG
jgi:Putative lumazine-binding